jgi:hypothetical protein
MSDQSNIYPRRRPGAPAGNTNALKHGFYARQLRSSDIRDLENCQEINLNDEINLIRVYIRRVIELSGQQTNLSETVDLLRHISLASLCLTRLIRTRTFLASNPIIPGTGEIRQFLEDLCREQEDLDDPSSQ